MSGYSQIKLPSHLCREMDKLVGKFGYTSRAEIAKDAIRRLLLETAQSLQPTMLEVPASG